MMQLEIPQDDVAEKGLLASLIRTPATCLEHAAVLGDYLFWNSAHRIIFQAVNALAQRHDKFDFPQLLIEAGKIANIEEVGGKEYLDEVWSFVPTGEAWEYYREAAFKSYRRRQAVLAAHKILDCEDPDEQEKISEEALQSMLIPKHAEFVSIGDRLNEAFQWLEDQKQSKRRSLVTFGIYELDSLLYPIEGGAQVVICSETGGGKSALACQTALQSSGACAIFSMEMPARELVLRMLASSSSVPLGNIRRSFLKKDELEEIASSVKTLSGKNIWIEDGPADFRTIASKCRILKNKGLELIIVDYLQLVTPTSTKKDVTREREVAEISRSLKLLAMELGIASIVLSQLNDDGKLRESRAIGQDADVILAVNSKDGEIEIMKQRNGPLGKVSIGFDGRFMRFSEA